MNFEMSENIYKIGYVAGIIAFTFTVGFIVVQILQLLGILSFPLDEILIYGFSFLITVPFVIEILALHYVTPPKKQFWSHAALIFSIFYVLFVSANYIVQLATVIPARLQGATEKVDLLIQYPHSMFWNYDALGYIFMGIATLFAVPVFSKKYKLQKWVRGFFIANGVVVPLIAFVYFYPQFSNNILLLGLPWAITAPGCMLVLAIWFKHTYALKFEKERRGFQE